MSFLSLLVILLYYHLKLIKPVFFSFLASLLALRLLGPLFVFCFFCFFWLRCLRTNSHFSVLPKPGFIFIYFVHDIDIFLHFLPGFQKWKSFFNLFFHAFSETVCGLHRKKVDSGSQWAFIRQIPWNSSFILKVLFSKTYKNNKNY